MNISQDKLRLLDSIVPSNVYIVTGEAGTGKTFAGGLCGAKLLRGKPKWQKVLYLTYSKLAKWQIIETLAKLVSEGLLDKETAGRMEIQNYHSLWWDIICKHRAFLGIDVLPRLCLFSELLQLVKDELDGLSQEERSCIIPREFLRQSDQALNERKRRALERALSGSSLLYGKWGCDHFGEDAKEFANAEDDFISWASDRINNRNKRGMFSHDETVWWAYRLLEKHPNAANLMRAVYPVMIIDEFQDIDISQWHVIKLIAPETLIVMGDIKQTIHRWRGAEPEQRFADLKIHCNEDGKYLGITEFLLTERNRSTKDMSLDDHIQTDFVRPDEKDWITKAKMLSKCKSYTLDGLRAKDGTIGIICISNELAQDVCAHLRQTQRRKDDGKVFGPHIRCARIGASNSPFEGAREILLRVVELVVDLDKIWLYVANDVAWFIMGLGKNKMPKCGRRSRNQEPVLRRNSAKTVAESMQKNFGKGLLAIEGFIFSLKQCHESCCDRQLLGCILHAGKGIFNLGQHSWNRLSLAEKKRRIEGSILQYENAQAGRMYEKVFIMTVHQAKGREFDTVIIPWHTSEKWNHADIHSWDMNQPDVKELFHTARTRAKKKLITIGIDNQ